jgi:hypothetical protein
MRLLDHEARQICVSENLMPLHASAWVAGTSMGGAKTWSKSWPTSCGGSGADQQSADELQELKQERDKAKATLEVLRTAGADAYNESVQALGPQTREHWQDRLAYDFEDGEPPFEANASDLLRFLTKLVLPAHEVREIQIKSPPVVQAQVLVSRWTRIVATRRTSTANREGY